MCWNEDVSLNTFIFSFFMLLLIAYNNTYTKYKIKELNNPFAYIFIFSIISIQLLEYFLWKNLGNKDINHMLSLVGTFIIYVQPIAALFLLKDTMMRNRLIFIYLLTLPFLLYQMNQIQVLSVVSKAGHLQWNWPNMGFVAFMYIIFLFYPLIVEKMYAIAGATAGLLMLSIYSYGKDNTYKSFWCWYANIFMIAYAFKLLVYLPHKLH